jgi:hypothetical protein
LGVLTLECGTCNGFATEDRVGRVVDLECERTRRLSVLIERDWRRSGDATVAVDADAVDDVRRWRKAAVMAAHRMGHKASTYAWRGEWVAALDVPVTVADNRRAAEILASLILPRPTHG